jgi:hypothetical protein
VPPASSRGGCFGPAAIARECVATRPNGVEWRGFQIIVAGDGAGAHGGAPGARQEPFGTFLTHLGGFGRPLFVERAGTRSRTRSCPTSTGRTTMAGSDLEQLDAAIEEAELSATRVWRLINRSRERGWRDAEAAQRELLAAINARLVVLRACRAIEAALARPTGP